MAGINEAWQRSLDWREDVPSAHEFGRDFEHHVSWLTMFAPSSNVTGQLQRKCGLLVVVDIPVMSPFSSCTRSLLVEDVKPELLGSNLNLKHLTHANLPLLL